MLEIRLQTVLSSYVAVGIMEYWALSMDLFDAKVTSTVKEWSKDFHSNANSDSNSTRDELLEWATQSPRIRRLLAPDILIYDYAVSVFKIQTAETLGYVWPAK